MTATQILNPAQLLDNGLSAASPDLMWDLLTTVINALMSAEADAVCGAEYGTNSPERVTSPTATGTGTPGPAPSTSRSPDSARGPTSPSGCSSVASGPRRR